AGRAARGRAGFAVNAQTPQPPPTSPGIPVSPQLPPSVGLDRLQSLVSPPEPGLPEGQLAGPSRADHGPRDGGGSPVGPTQPERKHTLSAGWLDGLRFHSANDNFHIHVGGNVQLDSNWLIAPNPAFHLPNNGGTSGVGRATPPPLRPARLRLPGGNLGPGGYIPECGLPNARHHPRPTPAPPSRL